MMYISSIALFVFYNSVFLLLVVDTKLVLASWVQIPVGGGAGPSSSSSSSLTSPLPSLLQIQRLPRYQRQQQRQPRLLSSTSDPTSSSRSQLTDWVVENLESPSSSSTSSSSESESPTTFKITSSSATKAGENDTLPLEGLIIGGRGRRGNSNKRVRILAADAPQDEDKKGKVIRDDDEAELHTIRLLVGRNGWGTGVHPTTRLCLEWMCEVVDEDLGQVVLDYGCGSGILSIAALHLGANKCIGVDVEAEALVTSERNLLLNGYGHEHFELLHTRQVLLFDPTIIAGANNGGGVDLCVANILIGQLVRPSMVATLVSNLKPGGLLCLSGIRPHQVDSLRQAYDEHVEEWLDDEYYAELDASETQGSLESYGFDCGRWARLVGRKKTSSSGSSSDDDMIAALSEMAVS